MLRMLIYKTDIQIVFFIALIVCTVGCRQTGDATPGSDETVKQNDTAKNEGKASSNHTVDKTIKQNNAVEKRPTLPSDARHAHFVQHKNKTMTYYSAKQALGRLTLHLRDSREPPPKKIWTAQPILRAINQKVSTGELRVFVSEWLISFEDDEGKTRSGHLTCWGDAIVANDPKNFVNSYTRSFLVDEWIVDNIEAHRIVLNHGGEDDTRDPGAALMSARVEGRGKRPIWTIWNMPSIKQPVMVDAHTGELYRPFKERTLQPLGITTKDINNEWNGGFDKNHKPTRNDIGCWPLCYQSRDGYYINNRRLLHKSIQKEESRQNRNASSWMKAAAFYALMGEWVDAIDGFTKAIEKDPANTHYRNYRGLCYIAVRDIKKAVEDFNFVQDATDKRLGFRYAAIVRGDEDREGLVALMRRIDTDEGSVPLRIQIGPIAIKSTRKTRDL